MIVVIATITFKEEHWEEGKRELEKLIVPTRAEEGCIQYDLHQNTSQPTEFVFYERWESKAHLDKHAATNHIATYRAATTPLLTNTSKVAIYELC